MYKMIFIDMDGTLLNSKTHISDENKKAIKFAHDKGVKVVLCSGRSHLDLVKFAKDLGIYGAECFISSFNGSVIVVGENNDVLRDTKIPLEEFKKIIGKLKEVASDFVVYPSMTTCYVEELINPLELGPYFEKSIMQYEMKKSILDDVFDGIFKIVAIGEISHLEEIISHMTPHIGKNINMFFSGKRYLEFTQKYGTKGHAVKYLAEHFGISPKNIIAIGDNGNDESMIKEAGLGVAMKNGTPELKSVADYVTEKTNDENGVAEVIYKFLK